MNGKNVTQNLDLENMNLSTHNCFDVIDSATYQVLDQINEQINLIKD